MRKKGVSPPTRAQGGHRQRPAGGGCSRRTPEVSLHHYHTPDYIFKFGKEAVDNLLLRGMIDSSQSCQRERERGRRCIGMDEHPRTTGLAVNAGGALWHLWPEMVEAKLKTVSRFCATSQIPPGVLRC